VLSCVLESFGAAGDDGKVGVVAHAAQQWFTLPHQQTDGNC
jgi:hypothetical protein